MELLFGSLRDTYKGPRNFVNCKGAQNTFSKISNTGKSFSDATHGSGTTSTNTWGCFKSQLYKTKFKLPVIKFLTETTSYMWLGIERWPPFSGIMLLCVDTVNLF